MPLRRDIGQRGALESWDQPGLCPLTWTKGALREAQRLHSGPARVKINGGSKS